MRECDANACVVCAVLVEEMVVVASYEGGRFSYVQVHVVSRRVSALLAPINRGALGAIGKAS